MNQMNERNFNINIGDTVSIFYQEKLLVKGIIYILGSIPVTKFYAKKYHDTRLGDFSYQNDIYEEAIVVIDDKNVENLTAGGEGMGVDINSLEFKTLQAIQK